MTRIPPKTKRVAGVGLHRKRDIVERGEIREQCRELKRARQAELAALVNWQICNVAAVESNAPAIRRDLSAQLADQCRFTGAVRANNRVQFTDWDSQRNAVGGDHSTETLGQHFDFQQSVSHGAPRKLSHQFRRALRSPRPAGTVLVSNSSIQLRARVPPRGPKK